MPYFGFNDETTIYYEEHGSGSHPVVMLHGLGASVESWSDIIPYLSHYRLFVLDMKGFGQSSKPSDSPYGVRDHVPYVIAFIKHLGVPAYSLVGHSHGGIVAMLVSREADLIGFHPKTLVLIDSPIIPVQFPLFIRALQTPILGKFLVSGISPSLQAFYILRILGHSPDFASKERVHRYAKYFGIPESQQALINTAKCLADDRNIKLELSGKFDNLLIIWGKEDPIFPLRIGQEMHRRLSGSLLVVIPSCGHIPQEEKPAETAEIISSFINGRSPISDELNSINAQ